jgi:hypothetical protein
MGFFHASKAEAIGGHTTQHIGPVLSLTISELCQLNQMGSISSFDATVSTKWSTTQPGQTSYKLQSTHEWSVRCWSPDKFVRDVQVASLPRTRPRLPLPRTSRGRPYEHGRRAASEERSAGWTPAPFPTTRIPDASDPVRCDG